MTETYRRQDVEASSELDAYEILERRAKAEGYVVLIRDHADALDNHPGRMRPWDVSLTVTRR